MARSHAQKSQPSSSTILHPLQGGKSVEFLSMLQEQHTQTVVSLSHLPSSTISYILQAEITPSPSLSPISSPLSSAPFFPAPSSAIYPEVGGKTVAHLSILDKQHTPARVSFLLNCSFTIY